MPGSHIPSQCFICRATVEDGSRICQDCASLLPPGFSASVSGVLADWDSGGSRPAITEPPNNQTAGREMRQAGLRDPEGELAHSQAELKRLEIFLGAQFAGQLLDIQSPVGRAIKLLERLKRKAG